MNEKRTIGVLIGNAKSPHSLNTLHGIMQAAKEEGVNIIVFLGIHASYFYKDFFKQEESYEYQITTVYDYVAMAKVDALIISYGEIVIFLSEEERKGFLNKFNNIPYVILDERVEKENVCYQISDNYNGMREVVEHLVDIHGYRRFVCLRGPIGNGEAEDRYQAFVDVMNEHHIEITENMVRVGDFSETVENEVEELLDLNPDLQAFVCANDMMASTVYAVCKKRRERLAEMDQDERQRRLKQNPQQYKIGVGIEEGEGFAVTGYDDWVISSTMDPPLTTIQQNAYSSGYISVHNVLSLLNGKGKSMVLPTKLIKRGSCGCHKYSKTQFTAMTESEKRSPELYAIRIAETIKDHILISNVNDIVGDKIYDILYDIIYGNAIMYLGYVNEKLSSARVVTQLRTLLENPYSSYLSPTALSSTYADYLSFIIHTTDNHMTEVLLSDILIDGLNYLQSFTYKRSRELLGDRENNTWFMSLISRDMTNHVDQEEVMIASAFKKLSYLGIGQCYMFLFDKPVTYIEGTEWVTPNEIYLAAQMDKDGEIITYEKKKRPLVTPKTGLVSFIKPTGDQDSFQVTMMNLYSEILQYGVIICEILPSEAMTLFYICTQISTALKYCEMTRQQKRAQENLQQLIKEVEEKNSMLRFISEYDSMTSCLNRRGFIERALDLNRGNCGRKALMIFTDLDHLKEINDTYGHAEGDFAILTISNILKEVIGEKEIICRLGGDEFVSVLLYEDDDFPNQLKEKIFLKTKQFNEESDKPYYIESTVGFKTFCCCEELDLQSIVEKADEALYEEKKQRRKTIVK